MTGYGMAAAYTRGVLDGRRSDLKCNEQPYFRSMPRYSTERLVYRLWYMRAQRAFGRGRYERRKT